MKKQYEIFKAIQDKLKNDKEFAREFYAVMMEGMFHCSQWAKVEDIKLGDRYLYQLKGE